MNSIVLSQVFTLETIKYYSFCDSLLHTYYLLRTLAYYPLTLCGIVGLFGWTSGDSVLEVGLEMCDLGEDF